MNDKGPNDLDQYLEEALQDPSFRALYYDGQHRDELIDLLKARREHLGLTVADVAERMGIMRHSVEAIEREGSDPRLSALQQYARAVNARLMVSVEE